MTLKKFTERETQIAELIATGKNNNEIAVALKISAETVKEHVCNALRKLNFSNRTQLAVWYVKERLVVGYAPRTVYLVLGDNDTICENKEATIQEFTFKTPEEMTAFLLGVETAEGWNDHFQADTREAAVKYIQDILADAAEPSPAPLL